jgi:uncharacterized protein YndB with AHSA1/START domain
MQIQRSVTVQRPIERVFAYLSDFTTTTEWDPGTIRTTLERGDGSVGTTYRNVSSFAGRQTELTYRVVELSPAHRFALRGENKTVVAHDTMEFTSIPRGTTVTYTADFSFKGFARLVAPLLRPALSKLGDEAERGMREALLRLESS